MENSYREVYPYEKTSYMIKDENGEDYEQSTYVPKLIIDKQVSMLDVFIALDDAKCLVRDKCKRGHNLNARKISADEVCALLFDLQDLLYNKSSKQ